MTGDAPTGDGKQRMQLSRRSLLKSGGAGLAAAAVAPFGGVTAGGSAAAADRKPDPRTLRPADPHAQTGRAGSARATFAMARGQGAGNVRILPIDRAKFLVGGRFDLRVEAYEVNPEDAQITISVRGPNGPVAILHGEPERTSTESDSLEVTYRGLQYPYAGAYSVRVDVRSGGQTRTAQVSHQVVAARAQGKRARNVIFFLGDGMGQPAITAARILSKGITEGKYDGLLEMDQVAFRGVVGTSGVDSIATDSANSMSAYMTGHKSSVNAMGVYEANTPDPNRHPRVETLAEMLKRSRDMAFGVVTTAEIQDATPAAVWAHTRRRSEYIEIMDQVLQPGQRPDVLLGGGRASLLPRSVPGSRRNDDRDLRQEFRDLGYTYVETATELRDAARRRPPRQLLGTFHTGNLDVFLDRSHPQRRRNDLNFPDQPTLVEMTEAALAVLEQRKQGFLLVVEGASIDKMEHPLDGPRAIYDTIEFDQAIGVAKRWADVRGEDTLIVVTADHNHSMSIVGTHSKRDDGTKEPDRERNGVYGDAGYPTYVDADRDGYPDDPDADVQLFFGWSNHPDHSDDFQHNDEFAQPALRDGSGRAVDNPQRDPGALEQIGNLPYIQTNCVHTVEDVGVSASGPGASRFNAFLDNTELFFAMADALHLRLPLDRQRGRQTAGDTSARTSGEERTARPLEAQPV